MRISKGEELMNLEEIIENWVRKLSYEELEFLKENYSIEEIEAELFEYFMGRR